MNHTDFIAALNDAEPPAGLSIALQALWHERKGAWTRAHDLLQNDHSANGAWVHAYLHRQEGDESNAAYWYRLASRPFPKLTLEQEWEAIVTELLS